MKFDIFIMTTNIFNSIKNDALKKTKKKYIFKEGERGRCDNGHGANTFYFPCFQTRLNDIFLCSILIIFSTENE